MKNKKKYSNSWFENVKTNFQLLTEKFANRCVQGLEVGSFEGQSSNWLVENWCAHSDSTLTCVDPFTGSVEHSDDEKNGLYERFMHNTQENSSKIKVVRSGSHLALQQMIEAGENFHFIYLDGDHHNLSVLVDAVFADKLLTKDGILIFDDYLWKLESEPYDKPFHAINYFFSIMKERYEVIISNYQVFAVKK